MTIHSDHPFLPPEPQRDPLRRLRGRMPLPVSVWTAERGGSRAGWTVSSMLVAEGDPPEVLGLLDEDSDLADLLTEGGEVAVSLLGWPHRRLADAFAGAAPAPGGAFRLGRWTETPWGPVLFDATAWLGARLLRAPDKAGWSLLLRGEIEKVEIGAAPIDGLLGYVRGRYRAIAGD
jgi:flavin reductase (DIM6/NTAB) family NADH-FMN oxidoreductase RutF